MVAEPDEKASAKRACSRAAIAFSKLSLEVLSVAGPLEEIAWARPVRV